MEFRRVLFRSPIGGSTVTSPASGMPAAGWWWNASEAGSGYFIEVQGTTLFMAAYMYADSGQAAWYTSTGAMTGTSVFQGSLVEYANGQTLTGTYQAPSVAADRGDNPQWLYTVAFEARALPADPRRYELYAQIANAAYRQKLAEAISEGVVAYVVRVRSKQ